MPVRAALDLDGLDRCDRAGRAVPALTAALADGRRSRPATPRPTPRVSVLPATVAKGLEYDHVVVVEPAEIVEAEPRGLNRLYVVLTRAVSRLDIVHKRRPLLSGRVG